MLSIPALEVLIGRLRAGKGVLADVLSEKLSNPVSERIDWELWVSQWREDLVPEMPLLDVALDQFFKHVVERIRPA